MNRIETKNWKRISKTEAKKLYDKGKAVFCLPCKLNPENWWTHPSIMPNEASVLNADKPSHEQIQEFNSFDRMVNHYTYYNCNDKESGLYPAFYINKSYER